MTALRILTRWWTAFALLASIAMLAVAHGFERYLGLPPCNLCLKQREVFWAAIAIALPATLWALVSRSSRGTPRIASFLLFAVFATSAITAGYHAGGELGWWELPAACVGVTGPIDLGALAALATGTAPPVRPPMCDAVLWSFAGLSMAGWNVVLSLGLAGFSLAGAMRPRDARAPRR